MARRMRWSNSVIAAVVSGMLGTAPAIAHQVRTSQDVGGTIHLEPNDQPRAGQSSLTWFALTRRGGQSIPLSDCDCRLAVYTSGSSTPIQQPTLSATSTGSSPNMPTATLTFPRAGSYELVLTGSPRGSASFTPFTLRFPVTVAQ